MSLIVRRVGGPCMIVDAGRPRARSLGVPVGGAADRAAQILGNAFLGNDPFSPALEFALSGPTLESTDTHSCAVSGADYEIWLNDKPLLPAHRSFNVNPGERIRFGAAHRGIAGYLCVGGGFQTDQILGSYTSISQLPTGFELACLSSWSRPRFVSERIHPDPWNCAEVTLRILPGLDFDRIETEEFCQRSTQEGPGRFEVQKESNRMGLRLCGPDLSLFGKDEEPVSRPVCPGTIQLTHNGQLIILGVDAQTIGGYPQLGHVIDADLDRLGQLRPGEKIQFQLVNLDTARELKTARDKALDEWATRLRNSRF